MIIAVSAKGFTLDSEVDPRFGRCNYFILLDDETGDFTSVSNESATASGGAGILAAQRLSQNAVKVVITGDVGPNAYSTLEAAGIRVITGASGTVKEAIAKFNAGTLRETNAPTAGPHQGMGGGGGRGMGRGRGGGGR